MKVEGTEIGKCYNVVDLHPLCSQTSLSLIDVTDMRSLEVSGMQEEQTRKTIVMFSQVFLERLQSPEEGKVAKNPYGNITPNNYLSK